MSLFDRITLQEGLNDLHHAWKKSGSATDRDAWHGAMKKSGLGHESAKIIMAPHAAEFRQRRQHFMRTVSEGKTGPFQRVKRSKQEMRRIVQSREDYERSQRDFAGKATEIGYHNRHGEFLHPTKNQHPLNHIDELGHAYGQRIHPHHLTKFKQRERGISSEVTVNSMPHAEADKGFSDAVSHHHGKRVMRGKDIEKTEPDQKRVVKHILRNRAWSHFNKSKDLDRDPPEAGEEWKSQ